jgi:hypothetical protein
VGYRSEIYRLAVVAAKQEPSSFAMSRDVNQNPSFGIIECIAAKQSR